MSYVVDSGDSIRSIRSADTIISFLNKAPLILVGVSRNRLSAHQLTVQLTYIYNQILFVLTLTQLTRIFQQRSNYDLRRMLSGSERLITHLSASMDTDPSFFLSSVRCLSLATGVRDLISESIIRYCGKKDVVFGLMVAENQLITLVRKKNCFIHPADLHLILNMINATESFKNSESSTRAVSFMPTCPMSAKRARHAWYSSRWTETHSSSYPRRELRLGSGWSDTM